MRQSYAYLKKALEQDPKNPEVQLKLAETDGGAGQFKEAVALLGLVLNQGPGNERALVLLAQLSPTNDLPPCASGWKHNCAREAKARRRLPLGPGLG